MKDRKVKLSDYVMQRIAAEGVKHVFLVPGGAAMHLNDSLGKTPGLEFVGNLHEQASAIAAEAYSRVTNGLGVAMVSAGPGGTNAITGVAGAWLDSTPCLFLSGQVKSADLRPNRELRQNGVQEIDIVSLVSAITKYAVTVTDPREIRFHLEKALFLARSGRRGPVWLDIPLDVQASDIDPASLHGFSADEKRTPSNASLQAAETLELLARAERPVILAGNGIRAAGAIKDFLDLIDRLGVPVLTTWLGIDLVPDTHPLFAGRPGAFAPRGANFALQNSDFLLAIGARLDPAVTGFADARLARGAKKVIVDIDPAELAKFKMAIDLQIVCDAGDFIRALSALSSREPLARWGAWLRRCQDWRTKYPLVTEEHRSRRDFVSTYAFSGLLSDSLSNDELLVTASSGTAIEIFLLAYRTKSGQRVFHNRGLGAMGFALPSSIGACLASGRRRTICVDGDGGFLFNVQELQTVRRLNLPIKFFILNNDGYASIRNSQKRYFQRLVGADRTSGMSLPDISRVTEAFGIPTNEFHLLGDLAGRLPAILEEQGPSVTQVFIPPEEIRAPSLASMQRPDGTMVSKPIEDLWPFLERDEFRSNMIVAPIEE